MMAIYIGIAFVVGAVIGMFLTAILVAGERDDRT